MTTKYYCKSCKRNHYFDSKIGQKHWNRCQLSVPIKKPKKLTFTEKTIIDYLKSNPNTPLGYIVNDTRLNRNVIEKTLDDLVKRNIITNDRYYYTVLK